MKSKDIRRNEQLAKQATELFNDPVKHVELWNRLDRLTFYVHFMDDALNEVDELFGAAIDQRLKQILQNAIKANNRLVEALRVDAHCFRTEENKNGDLAVLALSFKSWFDVMLTYCREEWQLVELERTIKNTCTEEVQKRHLDKHIAIIEEHKRNILNK